MNIEKINWEMIGAIAGVLSLIGAIFLFVLNKIKDDLKRSFQDGANDQRLAHVESQITTITTEIANARRDLTARIDNVIEMIARFGLSEARSPRQLSAEGKKVLHNSGVSSIVEDRFEYILRQTQKQNPRNPYQAEQAVLNSVEHLMDDPAIKDALEEGAFNSGYPIQAVLYVGSLYIRDRILKQLGLL